ncbi:hypothetical protein [Bibersteinia trehalosi]|uniref:hypothetical protein n=1 Tax=Bibersteinia trehalosi TaxID=47735 RepID=UPI002D76F38F|nr:hypothetical protein [Bibersteinia trehalosi]
MMRRYIFLAIFSGFLTACQTLPEPVQLPSQVESIKSFKIEQQTPKYQTSLLIVQFESQHWRWILTDPLGSPLARLILTPKGWQNDGFVMPNSQAKALFTALAVALNPSTPPFKLDEKWTIAKPEKSASYFLIGLPDNTWWKVEELSETAIN